MPRNAGTNAPAERPTPPVKLLFIEDRDCADVRGRLTHGANPLRRIDTARGLPAMTLSCPLPQPDGSLLIYGHQGAHNVADSTWRILRCRTFDGIAYDAVETLFTSERGHWYGSADIARNPRDGSFLCLKWGPGVPGIREKGGHACWAFGSADGQRWRPLLDRPVYHDHDSFGLTWDEATGRFIVFQATYQTWHKPYPDNAGPDTRRVMHFRTSPDGVHWTPAYDIARLGRHAPVARLLTPDRHDTPELEFYRFFGFPYGDRWAGMMLHYCPSPRCVEPQNLHGPHNGAEWWIGRDPLHWKRPFRETFAPGHAPWIIAHPPITLGGRHLWVMGREVCGLPEDRLFFTGARANAEFSTRPFLCPGRLHLNATLCYDEDPARAFRGQAYIMAEALDEKNRVIPGFEKESCILRHLDAPRTTLFWGDAREKRSGAHLRGRTIRIRFYLRDARLYALTGP